MLICSLSELSVLVVMIANQFKKNPFCSYFIAICLTFEGVFAF